MNELSNEIIKISKIDTQLLTQATTLQLAQSLVVSSKTSQVLSKAIKEELLTNNSRPNFKQRIFDENLNQHFLVEKKHNPSKIMNVINWTALIEEIFKKLNPEYNKIISDFLEINDENFEASDFFAIRFKLLEKQYKYFKDWKKEMIKLYHLEIITEEKDIISLKKVKKLKEIK